MIRISAEPSYAESLVARAIIASDQVANPLERAVFRCCLAEILAEERAERGCAGGKGPTMGVSPDRASLSLLLLLTRVERALTEPALTGPGLWTET